MERRISLITIAAVVAMLAHILPGCDELVTEVNEFTIAGHPTAEFSVNIDSGCAPLEVQFTDLSTGPRDEWSWYFGDGDSSNDTSPAHIYDSAGTYAVQLTIRNTPDEGEDTEVKKRLVIVGTTVSDFTAQPDSGCTGLEVTFAPTEFGGVSSWQWAFGDGSTSTDSSPTHVYTSDTATFYSVTLTVNGACGTYVVQKDSLIRITNCPRVAFHIDTAAGYTDFGCVPFDVKFIDSTDLGPDEGFVSRLWDFGNGETSSLPDPTVTYAEPGIYTVKLTVTSTGGTATDSTVDYITVQDSVRAVVSVLSAVEECFSPSVQFQVKFRADSVGTVDSLVWYFGDGTRSVDSDTTPVHAYVNPGTYTVILNSYGPCGDSAADTAADLITVADQLDPGSVAFTIVPDSGDTSITFEFTDVSSGVITDREWVIDTITVTNAPSQVVQRFADTGWYQISLTVSNPCGSVTVGDSVHVIESP